MKLKNWKYFAGPNVVALRPCVVAGLEAETPDSEPLEPPQLELAGALLGRSGFDRAVGTPVVTSRAALAFVAETTIALQSCLACPVSWWIAGTDNGNDEIAFETMRPVAAKEIIACALVLLAAAQGNVSEQEFVETFEQMRLAMRLRLHHYVQYDRVRTAASLGIENRTGFGMHYSYTRLGQGRHTRLLAPGYTDVTSHIGKNLAGRKDETTHALRAAKLPVALQLVAENEAEAVSAANAIGYPVVVKPLRGNRGRAVVVNLGNDESVRQAFRRAEEVYPIAVVEKYLAGEDFRLLVINGRFVAALRRPPPTLCGDGVSSVGALIKHENQNESRNNGIFLLPLSVDNEVLLTLWEQGLELDSVPEQGSLFHVRRAASPESMVIDVSDDVHPDNQALAVLAAEACGLDVAGIDLISTDIATSWHANGAGIVEVNAGPGVDLHMYPQSGKPRDISWHMIRACVPARSAGRIPVIMVTGRYGKQSISMQVLNLLALLGYCPGFSRHGSSREPGMLVEEGAQDVVAMLADRTIQAAVFSVSMRTLAEEGCPVAFPSISVLTDDYASGDESASRRVDRVHALVVDIAASAVIIDGTRPQLRKAAARRPAWQVGYVWSPSDGDASLETHLREGGWAVRVLGRESQSAWITLCQGRSEVRLAALDDLQDVMLEPERLRETLFAVATAVALGSSADVLNRAVHAVVCVPEGASTLTINSFGSSPKAACDPRDPLGLRRLRAFARPDSTSHPLLLAMINANDWMMGLAPTVIEILDSPHTHWCCIEPEGDALSSLFLSSAVDPERVRRFGSLGMARDEVASRTQTADVLALIELNEAERRAWCFAPNHNQPLRMTTAPSVSNGRWQASELAEIFGGCWVSGPGDGWAVQEIARDDEDDLADKLVVVGGGGSDEREIPGTEARVRAAFARGAAAVVARTLPIDLPRYWPVLVCDDIERGMRKLQVMITS